MQRIREGAEPDADLNRIGTEIYETDFGRERVSIVRCIECGEQVLVEKE
jgi:hypothetical protein